MCRGLLRIQVMQSHDADFSLIWTETLIFCSGTLAAYLSISINQRDQRGQNMLRRSVQRQQLPRHAVRYNALAAHASPIICVR
jgi:hypothetical protein